MKSSRLLRQVAQTTFSRPTLQRTHHLGELKVSDAGKEVVLSGWLARFRSRKGDRAFVDLQDSHGRMQFVVDELPESLAQSSDFDYRSLTRALSSVRAESILAIRGRVAERNEATKRPDLPNGEIEIFIESFEVLNPAEALPFLPSHRTADIGLPHANLLSKYRYLDLRRPEMSRNIKLRSKVTQIIRQSLLDEDFTEVETPMLLRSSPEGAREFLVPARTGFTPTGSAPTITAPTHITARSPLSSSTFPSVARALSASDAPALSEPPRFYALAQSPQQPKQLLIASGCVDKYFQFARCFRDEDGRKDRQPEFTQVDMERAFVSWRPDPASENRGWRIGGMEVRDSVERAVRRTWKEALGVELPQQFEVMTYKKAMSLYGSDKPDTRFELKLQPLQWLVKAPNLKNYLRPLYNIDVLVVRAADAPFQEAIKKLNLIRNPMPGIETWEVRSDELPWDRVRILREAAGREIPKLETELEKGDVIFFHLRKGDFEGGSTSLGDLRLKLFNQVQKQGLLEVPKDPHFLWVTEFPLFTRADSDKEFLAHGRWSSSHHPFTAPVWEDIKKLEEGEIALVRGQHYDLVLNGMEVGGGSVRIHDAKLQEFVFKEVLQLSNDECKPFETLLSALRSGAPPHGGIALGFDRLMAIICNAPSIRDVIAFPKTKGGSDLLFRSPSTVSEGALASYGLKYTSGRS